MAETEIPLDIPHTVLEDGSVSFEIDGRTIRAARSGSGWDYDGIGSAGPIHLSDRGDPPLRFAVRLASDESVARFAIPLLIAAGARSEIWVASPLEVVVLAGDVELDRIVPGRRKTLFGTVNEGRILPAAICPTLRAPDDPSIAGLPYAALRLRVHNRGHGAARLSRVPVIGGLLALHRRGDVFAATSVKVDLADGDQAEATTGSGSAPEGFETVAAPRSQPGQISHLGWLLDATRRSVEFPL